MSNIQIKNHLSILLIISFLLITGCAAPLLNYTSQTGKRNVIPAEAKLEVIVNANNIPKWYRKAETINSIINTIKSDLSTNLFNLTEWQDFKIEVNVTVNNITHKVEPWGFLWFPLVYFGVPVSKFIATTEITLDIYKKDGSLVKSYSSNNKTSKWAGIFSKYSWKSQFINIDALRLTMEDLKTQVISDREKIMSSIDSIEDSMAKSKVETLTLVSYPLYTGPKLSVAVIDMKSMQVPETVAMILSDILRDELFKTKRFRIMNRTEMGDILDEQGFQYSGACDDMACIVDMGKVLGVEKMIAGSISKLGELYYLSLKLVNVETAENEKIVSTKGKVQEEELPNLVQSAVLKLISE